MVAYALAIAICVIGIRGETRDNNSTSNEFNEVPGISKIECVEDSLSSWIMVKIDQDGSYNLLVTNAGSGEIVVNLHRGQTTVYLGIKKDGFTDSDSFFVSRAEP